MHTPLPRASLAIRGIARGFGLLLPVFLTLGGLAAAQSLEQQEKAKETLKVQYTGALFGYYRIEANENPVAPALPLVQSFLKELRTDSEKRELLLGMGDNFSPEFGGAIQQEFQQIPGSSTQSACSAPAPFPQSQADAEKWGIYAPETLYKSDGRLPALADCDNVTRFLMTAGYRAIVPGREDFLYSATWLRRIAILLRGASEPSRLGGNPFPGPGGPGDRPWSFGAIGNKDHRLQMLAANIRVSTTDPKKKAAGGDSKLYCPLFFSLDLSAGPECATGDNTISAQMAWLRRIDQTLPKKPTGSSSSGGGADAAQTVETTIQNRASHNPQFRRQLLANQLTIVSTLLAGYGCPKLPGAVTNFSKAETAIDKTDLQATRRTTQDSDREKDAGSALGTYLAQAKGAKFSDSCSAASGFPGDGDSVVQVVQGLKDALQPDSGTPKSNQQAFLGSEVRKTVVRLFLHLIAREQRDAGYTIATQPDGRRVLIVGVVGQETMKEITPDYFKVLPDNNDCPNGDTTGANTVCDDKKAVLEQRTGYAGGSAAAGSKVKDRRTAFDLNVGDPRAAVTTILRAAWEAERAGGDDDKFDYVVVMAQMPHSEADELGAHVHADLNSFSFDCPGGGPTCPAAPMIDLILSEAQEDHETGNFEAGVEPGGEAPVVTPFYAYERFTAKQIDGSTKWFADPNPISTTTLLEEPTPVFAQVTHILQNSVRAQGKPDPSLEGKTAAGLLEEEFSHYQAASDLTFTWDQCNRKPNCQNSVLMQYLLRTLQRSANADVALLKRRDFFFEALPGYYDGYEICDNWTRDHSSLPSPGNGRHSASDYCRLRIALDRVLWKGDYSERIMVDGTTLTGLMTTAQKQTDLEQTLLASDLHQEWLVSYGIVTQPPTNLGAAASGPETFAVPGDEGCANQTASDPSQGPQIPYCVDGLNIAPDHAYWVTTSNQLAEDKIVYSGLGALSAQSPSPVFAPRGLFLTTEIAREVTRHDQPDVLQATSKKGGVNNTAQASLARGELLQQDRNLFQLDFSKVVAGFTWTRPTLTDTAVGNDFAGVSNTQASTPHSQELDLEAAGRLVSSPWLGRLVFGVQNDAEYDRKVAGNLSSSPETVTYSANNLTVGPLAQIQLHPPFIPGLASVGIQQSTRNLPRAFLVIAPYQFQRQIDGTYVPFAYYTPAASLAPGAGATSKTQFNTIQIPTAMGFSQRMGLRFEASNKWYFDPGTYVELGPEYTILNDVLYQLLLPQLPAPYNVCTAQATLSFAKCVNNNYSNSPTQVPLDASSAIIPVPKTLHAGGLYWMAHVQKTIDTKKNYSASFDTSGDEFMIPGYTLPTETRYAFSTKLALNFKIAGNLSLSPTYSTFFFENQAPHVQRDSVVDNTFTIAAKWYFARDSAVPVRKQLIFSGPASTDQTSAAKVK